MRSLVVLLLLTPALVGCLDAGDDALDASAADGAGEVPALPEGLEMVGAEVVFYNETSVTWRWEESIGPGALGPETDQGPRVSTTFDVPSDLTVGINAELSWSDPNSHLGLRILDAHGDEACSHVRPVGTTEGAYPTRASCDAGTADLALGETWTVLIETWFNAGPTTAFLLELTLDTSTHPAVHALRNVDPAAEPKARVVLGFVDSGINPYHVSFRDFSSDAYRHPSTYIDGYPADAIALNVTFDAPNYHAAVAADEAIWSSIEEGQLYWVPGTRIIGAIVAEPPQPNECPLLDCAGHGTMSASRGAGADVGSCTQCKIVMAQGFQEAFEWVGGTPWVDVVANGWTDSDRIAASRADDDDLTARKPNFFPSGNGIERQGVVGEPAARYHHQGLPDVIAVGGHDNGDITAWTGSMPHIVADVCATSALSEELASVGRFGVGTSLSQPYAAGAAGQLVLEARRALQDQSIGVHDGILAKGSGSLFDEGPLLDGELTMGELRRLLFTTADPRPGQSEHDGPSCAPQEWTPRPWSTAPVPWRAIPEDVPAYYFIGYGAVNEDTLEHAKRVLRGEEAMPERPVEDAFFALDQQVRQALVEVNA